MVRVVVKKIRSSSALRLPATRIDYEGRMRRARSAQSRADGGRKSRNSQVIHAGLPSQTSHPKTPLHNRQVASIDCSVKLAILQRIQRTQLGDAFRNSKEEGRFAPSL
jgi:hypothetical protein